MLRNFAYVAYEWSSRETQTYYPKLIEGMSQDIHLDDCIAVGETKIEVQKVKATIIPIYKQCWFNLHTCYSNIRTIQTMPNEDIVLALY